MMSNNQQECPICRSSAYAYPDSNREMVFYTCPVCGRFEYDEKDNADGINENHLASYLFYKAFRKNLEYAERRYHTTLSKEKCDEYKKEYDRGNISHGLPVHMDSDIIEAWYPKTFAERIDRVLLYINSQTEHIGKPIKFSLFELMSMSFVDRKEKDHYTGKTSWRDNEECKREALFLLDYLTDNLLVSYTISSDNQAVSLTLLPKGLARIDSIQAEKSYGNNVFVAMKFGKETIALREAIRRGITDSGFSAIFIDEVEHNDYITPEMLKHIRSSKFVVVDLTHQNNGAYFEEGYAMGLGKTVIQLCQKDVQLHFDISQKNTIMWEREEDIPLRLKNRIKATID